jgi:receptor protein-tyrosine kinase
MNAGMVKRAHLVERALEAMGTSPLPGPIPVAPAAVASAGSAADRPVADVAERPAPSPPAAPRQPRAPAIPMARLEEAGLAFAVDASDRTKLMEELALVQHQLLRGLEPAAGEARAAPRHRLIMVTSARREEGKSFASLNLAASIASTASQPVLLIDVDGGISSLSARLGVLTEPGLLGLAAEPDRPREPLLRPTAIQRLSFLPHGRLPDSPARSPNPGAVAAAIRALAAALPRHVLILDTPPALSTSDAQALASIVGQVVMVVRAESTQRDEVEAALDLVEACPVLQLLLNRTRLATNDSFGAHGEYGAAKHA